ncbi:MAG TPA: hypothetical protein DEQ40_04155 [Oxalobacteraceae bacterium]|jgi:site-specific recombinase XerD|nr:hypothetical protein [Oxalobacteraceae bacterium]
MIVYRVHTRDGHASGSSSSTRLDGCDGSLVSKSLSHTYGFKLRKLHGAPLTRDGVAYILDKYVAMAAQKVPAVGRQKITPHSMRHSCAVGLLQAGIDVTVIRDYLSHASIATTSRYIATNLQLKREALYAFWRRAGISPVRAKP